MFNFFFIYIFISGGGRGSGGVTPVCDCITWFGSVTPGYILKDTKVGVWPRKISSPAFNIIPIYNCKTFSSDKLLRNIRRYINLPLVIMLSQAVALRWLKYNWFRKLLDKSGRNICVPCLMTWSFPNSVAAREKWTRNIQQSFGASVVCRGVDFYLLSYLLQQYK